MPLFQAINQTGSTDLQDGYDTATYQLRGCAECMAADLNATENRIILLTDAEANSGDYTVEGLSARVKANAADDIFTTIIGIGQDLNTELVDAMSRARGVNYYSVHTPGGCRWVGAVGAGGCTWVGGCRWVQMGAGGCRWVQPEDTIGLMGPPPPLPWSTSQLTGPRPPVDMLMPSPSSTACSVGSGEFKQRMGDDFDYMVSPLVFDLQLRVDPGSLASGWRMLAVYGSPNPNDTVLGGNGTIMRVDTLFPSPKTEEGIKGGVVLVRMAPPAAAAGSSNAAPLNLAVTYTDRSNQSYTSRRTVGAAPELLATESDGDFYQSTGVQKAVLLARYTDLIRSWWAGGARGLWRGGMGGWGEGG